MRKSKQIIHNFFYDIKDEFILNTLYILLFILKVSEHKERLLEILSVVSPETSIDDLYKATKQEIQYYEELAKEDKKYILCEKVKGNALNPIKDTPSIWCFLSLYWAYQPEKNNQYFLIKIYNHKIGDLALKFLLYFHKMKQKEENTSVKHKDSFYEDLTPRVVRIIDILSEMSKQNNHYINELYLPSKEKDLAINFLHIQINNKWEQTVFSIKLSTEIKKEVIIYKHDGERLDFTIIPSRTTTKGSLNNLNKTYSQLMKLYNLDLANSTNNYSLGGKKLYIIKNFRAIPTEQEEELIYAEEDIDSEIQNMEDQIEKRLTRKVYRRDMKVSNKAEEDLVEKEYVIPNAFQQHKRNIAFSSSLSKHKLLLASDYDIPTNLHLKAFCASLPLNNLKNKAYTGFFILSVILGAKPEDIMYLLQEKEEGSLEYKNATIEIKINNSLFANHYSSLLDKNKNVLKFGTHTILNILIIFMKRTINSKEFQKRIFLNSYKRFIKYAVKEFPKTITIKWNQTHRYLAQYMQENGKDVFTGKLITSAYTQNDTAKLAYTSTRSNATEHSHLLIEYWNTLDLNEVAKKIIGINSIPTSNTSSVASQDFTGSSQGVNAEKTTAFFITLRNNIFNTQEDQNLYFNLVSIYSRYAMSILAGTRTFKESGNFTSYNEELGIWFINEKAQDVASGTRLVPICDTLKSILYFYQKLLKEKGLKNNFFLTIDDEYVPFTVYLAHKIIKNTPNLEDGETLEEYVRDVPLNTGRHLFVRKAIDELVNVHYISTYLSHYAAGEEHLGIYSTLDINNYSKTIKTLTTKISHEYGIKEL